MYFSWLQIGTVDLYLFSFPWWDLLNVWFLHQEWPILVHVPELNNNNNNNNNNMNHSNKKKSISNNNNTMTSISTRRGNKTTGQMALTKQYNDGFIQYTNNRPTIMIKLKRKQTYDHRTSINQNKWKFVPLLLRVKNISVPIPILLLI